MSLVPCFVCDGSHDMTSDVRKDSIKYVLVSIHWLNLQVPRWIVALTVESFRTPHHKCIQLIFFAFSLRDNSIRLRYVNTSGSHLKLPLKLHLPKTKSIHFSRNGNPEILGRLSSDHLHSLITDRNHLGASTRHCFGSAVGRRWLF